jgi:hypothetical protein
MAVPALFGLDDLAALIEAAIRANAMRELRLAALRAYRMRRRIDTVVKGTAPVGANAAHPLLRYCHG